MDSLHLVSVSPNKRILVVDDLEDNLFLLQAVLEVEGYQVDVADSGKAALAKIELEPPDLLLLDVMMPGMDGCEVVQHIRQNGMPFIPIVLVTGCDRPHQSLALDIEGFIAKPIDFDKLLNCVGAMLAMPVAETKLETKILETKVLETKAIADRQLAS